mmetsp:Transcript_11592/g.36697  ORF Transcript_11592/g.36697 Transcript_11592/m.36697 type:complete len:253 (+) Transcript_11592:272-1030(+)
MWSTRCGTSSPASPKWRPSSNSRTRGALPTWVCPMPTQSPPWTRTCFPTTVWCPRTSPRWWRTRGRTTAPTRTQMRSAPSAAPLYASSRCTSSPSTMPPWRRRASRTWLLSPLRILSSPTPPPTWRRGGGWRSPTRWCARSRGMMRTGTASPTASRRRPPTGRPPSWRMPPSSTYRWWGSGGRTRSGTQWTTHGAGGTATAQTHRPSARPRTCTCRSGTRPGPRGRWAGISQPPRTASSSRAWAVGPSSGTA